jgi:hypothetical protein
VVAQLVQPNRWAGWVEMFSTRRRTELAHQRLALSRGETPDLRNLGTQLIVAHASRISCSANGTRQTFIFDTAPPHTYDEQALAKGHPR